MRKVKRDIEKKQQETISEEVDKVNI